MFSPWLAPRTVHGLSTNCPQTPHALSMGSPRPAQSTDTSRGVHAHPMDWPRTAHELWSSGDIWPRAELGHPRRTIERPTDCAWTSHGLSTGLTVHQPSTDCPWTPHRRPMHTPRVAHGLATVGAWPVRGQSVECSPWTVRGQSVDSPGGVGGLCMGSPQSVDGVSVEGPCTVRGISRDAHGEFMVPLGGYYASHVDRPCGCPWGIRGASVRLP